MDGCNELAVENDEKDTLVKSFRVFINETAVDWTGGKGTMDDDIGLFFFKLLYSWKSVDISSTKPRLFIIEDSLNSFCWLDETWFSVIVKSDIEGKGIPSGEGLVEWIIFGLLLIRTWTVRLIGICFDSLLIINGSSISDGFNSSSRLTQCFDWKTFAELFIKWCWRSVGVCALGIRVPNVIKKFYF